MGSMDPTKNESEAEHEELDVYADGAITSGHGKIPRWLWWFYIGMPIWGLVWLYVYWNGSFGWADNGYWEQLQRAANTTSPYINVNELPKKSPDGH